MIEHSWDKKPSPPKILTEEKLLELKEEYDNRQKEKPVAQPKAAKGSFFSTFLRLIKGGK